MIVTKRWLVGAALAVAVLQIGFLVSMIAGRASVLRTGQEVTLEVLPIDPRDLLRGDYVILGYPISTIGADLFADPLPGDGEGAARTVYVRLRPGDDGLWQAGAASLDAPPQPAPGENEVDIRGTIQDSWFEGQTLVSVSYGIERYYVPEGEGREIEQGIGVRPFRVKVAVARDGAAQIKALYDGDVMLYEEPFF